MGRRVKGSGDEAAEVVVGSRQWGSWVEGCDEEVEVGHIWDIRGTGKGFESVGRGEGVWLGGRK